MGQTPAAPLAPAAGTTGSGEGRPYQTSDAELERSIFVNYLPDVRFELSNPHNALQPFAASWGNHGAVLHPCRLFMCRRLQAAAR